MASIIIVWLAILFFYLLLPQGIAMVATRGIKWLGREMNWSAVEIAKRSEVYPYLFFRPEVYVVLAKTSLSKTEILLTYWGFTTFMTALTWWLTTKGQKALKGSWLSKKLTEINSKWLKFLTGRYGRYAVLIPHTFPIIPAIDTAAVVTGKILKVNFWLFIAINSIKGIILLF